MKKKTHKIHLSTLNVHSACQKAILYFTAFIRGLSNNNIVLSNGCVIRYINAFPYYRSRSKGSHHFQSCSSSGNNLDQCWQTLNILSSCFTHRSLEIVLEQVLVLFRAGTTSLQSGLGTFFVPELDHARHFRLIFSVYHCYTVTDSINQCCLLCKLYKHLNNFHLT